LQQYINNAYLKKTLKPHYFKGRQSKNAGKKRASTLKHINPKNRTINNH